MSLKIMNQQYYDEVEAFAKSMGPEIEKSFRDNIEYLTNFACRTSSGIDRTLCEVKLSKDFARYSFEWAAYRKGQDRCFINGGMIYHGPGAGETYAVTLEPVHGWSIHT